MKKLLFTIHHRVYLCFSDLCLILGFIFFDRVVEITFILLFLGYRTRAVSLLFGILMLFGHTYLYSFGKIAHNIYMLTVPLIMAFSGWGGAYSVDADVRLKNIKAQGWPLVYLSFLLGIGYLTAAVPKILGGWLSYDELMSQGILFKKYYYHGNTDYLSEFFVHIDHHFTYKMMDYGTLLFETFFILAIFKTKWLYKALPIAAIFHLGVILSLKITFSSHLITFFKREGCNMLLLALS